jgi:hypothetical protein
MLISAPFDDSLFDLERIAVLRGTSLSAVFRIYICGKLAN